MKRATQFSCGYDITVSEYNMIPAGSRKAISTGLFLPKNFPQGCFGLLKSRSSLALKGIDVVAGVIDADYPDEIKVILHNSSNEYFEVHVGDRIAQMIILPYKTFGDEVEKKREGGFGSTGF